MRDNQHYVSKAHLDKFVYPTSQQKVLYPYAKGKGALCPTGTRQLASADRFYLQQESGDLTNKLDEARKEREALLFASGKRTSGPLAKCIYEDGFTPSASDRTILAEAAAFLRCGSPVQVHNTAMLALMSEQTEVFNRLNTDQAKDEYKRRYGDDADHRLQEDREAFWEGRLFVDVGEENWKQLGFNSFQTEELWLNILSEMGLTICHAHSGSCFVTSDNPVILTCNSRKDSPGLGLEDAEVWFPVSHKKGLLWTWRHRGADATTLGHSATRTLNRKMIRWCFREIYAPLPEDWIGMAVKEETFDPRYGHYGSLKEVAENHSLQAVDESGTSREIIDLLCALRTGDKLDVLKLKR